MAKRKSNLEAGPGAGGLWRGAVPGAARRGAGCLGLIKHSSPRAPRFSSRRKQKGVRVDLRDPGRAPSPFRLDLLFRDRRTPCR